MSQCHYIYVQTAKRPIEGTDNKIHTAKHTWVTISLACTDSLVLLGQFRQEKAAEHFELCDSATVSKRQKCQLVE